MLRRRMKELQSYPGLGPRRDDIRPGLRGLTCRRHIILYEEGPDAIRIVRVLHGSMDAATSLRGLTPDNE